MVRGDVEFPKKGQRKKIKTERKTIRGKKMCSELSDPNPPNLNPNRVDGTQGQTDTGYTIKRVSTAPPQPINVTIKNLANGNSHKIEIDSKDSVKRLREKISEETMIPAFQIKLFHKKALVGGVNVTEDDEELHDYRLIIFDEEPGWMNDNGYWSKTWGGQRIREEKYVVGHMPAYEVGTGVLHPYSAKRSNDITPEECSYKIEDGDEIGLQRFVEVQRTFETRGMGKNLMQVKLKYDCDCSYTIGWLKQKVYDDPIYQEEAFDLLEQLPVDRQRMFHGPKMSRAGIEEILDDNMLIGSCEFDNIKEFHCVKRLTAEDVERINNDPRFSYRKNKAPPPPKMPGIN